MRARKQPRSRAAGRLWLPETSAGPNTAFLLTRLKHVQVFRPTVNKTIGTASTLVRTSSVWWGKSTGEKRQQLSKGAASFKASTLKRGPSDRPLRKQAPERFTQIKLSWQVASSVLTGENTMNLNRHPTQKKKKNDREQKGAAAAMADQTDLAHLPSERCEINQI